MIETYQTLIVGILGFLGVIATLIFNSKLSRDLRKDELKHERNSIRQALITELESLKGSFKDKSESVETDQDWFLPKNIETGIYDVLLPQISLLTREEIKHVLHAYLLVRETPIRLSLLAAATDLDKTPDEYFHIKNKHVVTVRIVLAAFIPDIDKAISCLSKELNKGDTKGNQTG
ncbi:MULTISPECIES: hypothetical protein [unclassified Methylophaga]|uniref:hypothetical protein n=1 Tax=unclassified Methylophaga TaxID=2629249 RepID=UPI0025FFA255|nr:MULTISPECIES: hypothetical protein [unclassified Methylophaga]